MIYFLWWIKNCLWWPESVTKLAVMKALGCFIVIQLLFSKLINYLVESYSVISLSYWSVSWKNSKRRYVNKNFHKISINSFVKINEPTVLRIQSFQINSNSPRWKGIVRSNSLKHEPFLKCLFKTLLLLNSYCSSHGCGLWTEEVCRP